MSQPIPYSRAFSFTNFQASNPTAALPGSQVDLELNNAKATLDATLANLALIQRDDGGIKNATVGLDQLKAEVPVGFNAPVVWATGTAYAAGSSTVFNGSGFYRCLIAHTSGVFATDLAAAKWQLIVDLSAVPLVNASQIAVTPSGLLTSNAQTSLQALDAGKAPTSHTHPSSAISDSTAAGRALLTAADVPTQQTLLGFATQGFQSGDVKETAAIALPTGWYWCDGSSKNRVTDASLFNAITIQQSGVLVNGSAVITGLSDTSFMATGMPISGLGIPPGSAIQSVDSVSQITSNFSATVSGTNPLVIAPYGAGDGSTTFGIPNRAYIAVGRDNASGAAANITQVSGTISITSGSTTAAVTSAAGLFLGMFVSHPKVPVGTTITAINGTALTLSAAATGTVTSAARFSPLPDAQRQGATGGALTSTIVTSNLPAYAPTGTVASTFSAGAATYSVRTYVTSGSNVNTQLSLASNIGTDAGLLSATSVTGTVTSTLTGTAQGGASTPLRTVMPIIVMNFIIKR